MTTRTARWIAWAIVVIYVSLAAAGLTLQGFAHTAYAQTTLLVLIILVSIVGVWIVTGALIISRHPRHPIGWLLCAAFIIGAMDMFAAGYAAYDTNVLSGSLPGVNLALLWLKLVLLGPHGVVAFTLIILLFPDGRFLSSAWRKIAWLTVGALLLFLPLQAVEPGLVDPSFLADRTNPLGVNASLWAILRPLMWAAFSIMVLCYGAAFVSLILRLRNSRGDVQQQIKWLLFPAGMFGIFLLVFIAGIAQGNEVISDAGIVLGQVAITGMVITVAFAIFKYRLYDVDILINRALVYGGLTVAVAILYALSVGVASLGLQQGSQWAAILLTAGIVIIFFKPLHNAVQQRVDRFMSLAKRALSARKTRQDNPLAEGDLKQVESKGATIPQRWRKLLRRAWYLFAIFAWGNFLLSIPARIITIGNDFPGSLVPPILLFFLKFTDVLVFTAGALTSLVLATVLFVKRPNDRMGQFLSFFMLVYSIVVAGPLLFLEPYWPGVREFGYSVVQASLFAPFLVAFLSIFPTGRFTPSWTRGLVVVSILHGIVSPFIFTLGADSTLTTYIGVFIWFALFFAGLYAQFYRYGNFSNPVERQQTKWVVYGFSLELLLAILLSVLTLGLMGMPAGIPLPWLTPFAQLGWSLALALLPISLTIAVLRYRLYDIDVLINRTLVYGVLTGSVIALYALTVGALGVLFQSGGNLLVALVATGLVAVLFQPLRVRLQNGVNRLMYGERDEPFTVLRRLGERLEGSGMPEETLDAIVETVVQALKLPYAEITLRRGEKFERAARYGKPVEGIISFPIQYQGQIVGHLNAGVRGPRESLTGMDEQLLHQIAQQAGPVAQSVLLTRDLRRSRARLITAREEERRRLRRDLHDGLGPVLASQGLKIAAVHHLLDNDPDLARKLLNEMSAQNESTVAEIRRLVYALRPPELDELGLAGAVREYTAGLNVSKDNGTSFEVDIQLAGENLKQLPAAVEVAAYRIATEALANVTRHAHARSCTISFMMGGSSNGRQLLLEIADDGIGFEENGRAGIGLNSMHERAEEVGGELQIESVVHQGTRVRAAFPLAE